MRKPAPTPHAVTTVQFRWLLTEHGGLDVVRVYPPDDRFLTAICKK